MEWIDEYMKLLAKHEGTRPAKATEGGGYTRGYGITTLADNFVSALLKNKGLNASEMQDKELAKEYVIWNAGQISKQFDNYDEWPDSVKMAAVDLAYNGGRITRYANFSRFLREGKYQDAMKETLDIVTANDPKTSKSGALRGLGNRRFDIYNYVARELDFPEITDLKVVERGTGSLFSYTTADGSAIDKAIGSPIHSASGKYDTLKKKTRPVDDITSPDDAMLDEVVKPEKPALDSAEPIAPTPVEETVLSTVPPDVEARKDRVAKLTEAMFPESDEEVAQEVLGTEEEPEEELQLIPTPEEGSFDSIFGVPQFGVQQAEESFALPEDYVPDEYTSTTAQRQRQQKQDVDNADVSREVNNTFTPKRKGYADIPTPSDIIQTQDGPMQRRYGDPVQSRLNEDQYDYDMFMPTDSQGFGAAFRQFNVMPNIAEMFGRMVNPRMRAVEGYDPYQDRKLKQLVGEDNMFFFRHVGSHNQAMDKFNRLAEDYEDMKLLDRYRGKTGASITICCGIVVP